MLQVGVSESVRGASAGARPTLFDLINDTLAVLGTHPALAGPGLMLQATVESPAARRPSPLSGHGSRALATVPPATSDDGKRNAPAETEDVDGEIDRDHVETWRLVRLAQDGDGDAFGMLYDRYVDSVFRFIYYRVSDRALAEDFTSETFVRALRRISTITYQGRDIGAWFVTIARNIVLDHVKSARHRLETSTGEVIEGKEHAQSTESAVLESLASERLMQAVAQLGDEQRECVMLRFMQGLSVNETAAVMGRNDGAIKALQHRAVRKLADLIGDDLR